MSAFKGKSVLVLGGSRGIGAAIVRRFSADGAAVTFTFSGSQRAAEQLASDTGSKAVQTDSADRSAVIARVRQSRWGGWLPLTASECQSVVAVEASTRRSHPHGDYHDRPRLGQEHFQVHAVDAAGEPVVRKTLRRAQVLPFFAKLPPCLVGMEACGTSHHWARELTKAGHQVRLMPPAYVKPYVKRGKTDAADAEAICEAVQRPSMRFVPVKSGEQQAALALHRTRDLLVKQRTQLVNMVRGLLAEFGIEMARGLHHALDLARRLVAGEAPEVPALAQRVVTGLADQIAAL